MSVRLRLFLASSLMLFTELMLIRWLGANLLHLSYFSNIVLLGSFLGIGLGFLVARPDRQARGVVRPGARGAAARRPVHPRRRRPDGSDLIYFTAVEHEGVVAPGRDPHAGLRRRRGGAHGPGDHGRRSASSSCRASTPTASTCSAASPARCSSRRCRTSAPAPWSGRSSSPRSSCCCVRGRGRRQRGAQRDRGRRRGRGDVGGRAQGRRHLVAVLQDQRRSTRSRPTSPASRRRRTR